MLHRARVSVPSNGRAAPSRAVSAFACQPPPSLRLWRSAQAVRKTQGAPLDVSDLRLGRVSREAVEHSRAAGADEPFLAATSARMCGVPRSIGAAGAVLVPQHGSTLATARPVVAGMIHSVSEGAPVGG